MTTAKHLSADELYRPCDPALLDFETTAEVEELTEMIGQDRAVDAVRFGADIDLHGFNLFVLGPPGTGRHSFVKRFLEDKARHQKAPSDWVYVNNFDEPRNPRALELPAGRGCRLRDHIARLIDEAHRAIPAAFESADYRKQRQEIEERAQEEQNNAFEEIRAHALARGLGIVQTATGFTFVPLKDGKEITPKEYAALSEKEQKRLQQDTEELAEELKQMLQKIPRRVRAVFEEIHKLDRDVALFAVGSLVNELLEEYASLPKVSEHLKSIQQDIVDNIPLFREGGSQKEQPLKMLLGGKPVTDQDGSPMRRYAVNVLIDHASDTGAPVEFPDEPTFQELVGNIEYKAQMGTLVTDFTLLKPGALHRANGGYLVLDARKLLVQPYAYEALKQALKSHEIKIRSLGQIFSLVSTVSLEPEPIPLKVKVALIGERIFYYLLQWYDPEFSELFRVEADFDDRMPRDPENERQYARLLGTIARDEKLLPLDRSAAARVIEESARHAGDAERLSAQVRKAADLVREAHYRAVQHERQTINAEDVQAAVDHQIRRASRVQDRLQEEILRGTFLIDSGGAVAGQVNGLSVIELGGYLFGRPARITARLSLGSGKVIDIEREVELGGPIHSKGVLILSRYLASNFVTDRPLSLSASLVFEQSYGGVEGDSASAAELCALLSALADAPLRQSLAITGSVNQFGQVQAIGGVNEKIEGFFDICNARGLSGDQGVVIPASNIKHLMLRSRVVEAVRDGRFHVYAVDHVDQALALLTGIAAGERQADGSFPEGTLNRRVTDRLVELAEKRRAFGSEKDERKGKG
jgi:lon-related putative ATP-dependent protease